MSGGHGGPGPRPLTGCAAWGKLLGVLEHPRPPVRWDKGQSQAHEGVWRMAGVSREVWGSGTCWASGDPVVQVTGLVPHSRGQLGEGLSQGPPSPQRGLACGGP